MWAKTIAMGVIGLFGVAALGACGPAGDSSDAGRAIDVPAVVPERLDFSGHPSVFSAALPAGHGHWSAYDCLPGFSFDGAETVYAMELTAPGQLAAEIEVMAGANAAVVVVDPSEGQVQCVAGGTRRAVAEDLDAGVYWIIVDAAASASPSVEYRLAVEPDLYDQWVERDVAPGIVWQRFLGRESAQSINVLRISKAARTGGAEVGGVYAGGRCETVGSMGRREGALAGVNASFHTRMSESGSTTAATHGQPLLVTRCEPESGMVKVDGTVHTPNRGTRLTLGADPTGEVRMESIRENDPWNAMPTAFGGDPSLIPYEDVGDVAHIVNPRTAVGLAEDEQLIIVTVDGRTSVGDGLTLPEMAALLRSLGAKQAINLDGGGSSTMWIAGTTLSGVVNYPSDGWDGTTPPDHEQSRRVSDGLFIFAN
ncbi:MAG: phosphodiester glycosidase family protein [Myxococcales bacterium FL481]|nr:MAG: phosphodiester glycosidase family protein [Myxococcales bacterium FL481]